MSECKHENSYLIGTADGILCRGCGRLFKSFDEIPREPDPEPEKPKKPKKKSKEDA